VNKMGFCNAPMRFLHDRICLKFPVKYDENASEVMSLLVFSMAILSCRFLKVSLLDCLWINPTFLH